MKIKELWKKIKDVWTIHKPQEGVIRKDVKKIGRKNRKGY